LQFLGPIVILALALTFRYLYKKDSNVEWVEKNYLHPKFFKNPS
jgi:hypothetical protein